MRLHPTAWASIHVTYARLLPAVRGRRIRTGLWQFRKLLTDKRLISPFTYHVTFDELAEGLDFWKELGLELLFQVGVDGGLRLENKVPIRESEQGFAKRFWCNGFDCRLDQ
jgi:hypothetical protein